MLLLEKTFDILAALVRQPWRDPLVGLLSWSWCPSWLPGGRARRAGPTAGSCGRGYARAVGGRYLTPPWPISASQDSPSCIPKVPIWVLSQSSIFGAKSKNRVSEIQ